MKIIKSTPRNALKPSHRKNEFDRAFKVITSQGETVVDCRIYWPGTVAYACLWVNGNDICASGSDKAGGYGYCKTSAAIAGAIESAGFELSENVAGRGIRAASDALLALARHIKPRRKLLFVECYA